MSKAIIITTVGTSVFSNYIDKKCITPQEVSTFRTNWDKLIYQNPDEKPKEKRIYIKTSKEQWDIEYKTIFTNATNKKIDKAAIKSWGEKEGRFNASAELKSLSEIAKEYDEIEVKLLTSYTFDGYLAGEILKDILSTDSFKKTLKIKDNGVSLTKIEGLVVNDTDSFQDKALNFIIAEINRTEKYLKDTKQKAKIILNITGGYKALIPFLTIIGQLKKIDLKYIYEDSDKLISVSGDLPIHLDSELLQASLQYLSIEWQDIAISNLEIDGIELLAEKGLIKIDKLTNKYKASALGLFMHNFAMNRSEQAISKSVLGLFVETKMYEYFNEHKPYSEPRKFFFKNKWFIDSRPNNYKLYDEINLRTQFSIDNSCKISDNLREKIKKESGAKITPIEDIDLTVYDGNNFSLCEVKSIDEVKEIYLLKIQGRIDAYAKEFPDTSVHQFIFIVYKIKFQHEKIDTKTNQQKIEGLCTNLRYFKNNIKLNFKALYFEIDLINNDIVVNYTNLLREPIIVKELNLDCKNNS
jgi:CRISPR/Cas system-associated protein Csm6